MDAVHLKTWSSRDLQDLVTLSLQGSKIGWYLTACICSKKSIISYVLYCFISGLGNFLWRNLCKVQRTNFWIHIVNLISLKDFLRTAENSWNSLSKCCGNLQNYWLMRIFQEQFCWYSSEWPLPLICSS